MREYFGCILLLMIVSVSFAQQPKIIAHRGVWKNSKVPQNSIASLKESLKQKVWGSEFDVAFTKDNILVINHDADYQGMDIATTNYKDLLTKKMSNGEQIPTLEEYYKVGLGQSSVKMVFELKSNSMGVERTIESVVASYEILKKMNAISQTVIISFSYPACLKFRELDRNIKIQYLNGDKSPAELKKDNIDGLDYNGLVYMQQPNLLNEAKQLGLETNVWTINEQEHLEKCIALGIDYITTDEPELLKKLMK